jgi:16S rRNA processing protein RimM
MNNELQDQTPPEYLAVACIVKPHGRKGEVVAEVLTDFPERFDKSQQEVYLELPASAPRPAVLESARMHKGRVIVKFTGVDSIDQASRLRGAHVLIRRDERMLVSAHRYYVWELKGCRVVRERDAGLNTQSEIGIVTDVETGSGGVDLLHVALSGGSQGEVLVPFVQSICTRIDIEAKVISIDPPEELLELNL